MTQIEIQWKKISTFVCHLRRCRRDIMSKFVLVLQLQRISYIYVLECDPMMRMNYCHKVYFTINYENFIETSYQNRLHGTFQKLCSMIHSPVLPHVPSNKYFLPISPLFFIDFFFLISSWPYILWIFHNDIDIIHLYIRKFINRITAYNKVGISPAISCSKGLALLAEPRTPLVI